MVLCNILEMGDVTELVGLLRAKRVENFLKTPFCEVQGVYKLI